MKIALFGYGKMGKMIEALAIQKGHEVVLKIDIDNRKTIDVATLKSADVAIEFTTPLSAVENIKLCFDAEIPVVVGSTGWLENLDEVSVACIEKNGTILYASNFSIGVNILFALNEYLSAIMAKEPEYKVQIEEIHHTQKLDAPSGTALSLADGIFKNITRFLKQSRTFLKGTEIPETAALPIFYERIDSVPGTHSVIYKSTEDKISITHEAFNREGFALGAIKAAEFVIGKKGIFTAKDLFKF